jgi:hypothetical protein
MSKLLRGVAFALLIAAVPVLAQDKEKGKPNPRNDQDLTPLVLAGEATGRIARVNSGSSFTLELVLPSAQPLVRRPGGLRAALTRPSGTRKQYILDVADDVQVRVMQLPMQFDDKGKPKKYTSEEMKELRGPHANLPGYKSDYDSLRTGQVVTVSFRRFQSPTTASTKEADKDKDKDKKAASDPGPRVGLIVILSDGDAAAAARKEDADKKKK